MAENETIALEQDDAFWRKAAWLLLRRLGGEVDVTAEEWASVSEEPCMIIGGMEGVTRWGKTYDVMRWTAREPEQALPVAAALDPLETDVPLPFPEEP